MADNNETPRKALSPEKTEGDRVKGPVERTDKLDDEALGVISGGLGDIVITKVIDQPSPK